MHKTCLVFYFFVRVRKTEILDFLEFPDLPSIRFYRHEDSGLFDFSVPFDNANFSTIRSFLVDNFHPKYNHFSLKNLPSLLQQQNFTLFVIYDSSVSASKSKAETIISRTSKEFSLNLFLADIWDIGEIIFQFGIKELKSEMFSFVQFASSSTLRTKYNFEKKVNYKNIRAWISDFLSGSLTPSLISEPIPDNTGAIVQKLVAKTFPEVYSNFSSKSVILFLAGSSDRQNQISQITDFAEEWFQNPEIDLNFYSFDLDYNEVSSDYSFLRKHHETFLVYLNNHTHRRPALLPLNLTLQDLKNTIKNQNVFNSGKIRRSNFDDDEFDL